MSKHAIMSISPKRLFPIQEQAANNRFSFYRKLQQRYFWFSNWRLMILLDKLSRSIIKLMKFHTPHQEFIIQNLHALLWCKLHRSTSSQLGTKLYPSIATFVTCGQVAHKTSRQIVGKWIATHHINNQGRLLPFFHFFVYRKLNFYANYSEVSK